MASEVAIYTVVHQPRRLKLPAQPIPAGASVEDIERCVFDDAMDARYFARVAERCYYPATERFIACARAGMKVGIGFSLSVLRQAERYDPALLERFRALVAEPNVELIGVEPYHSFVFLLDMPLFVERMRWMRSEMERLLGARPRVTDTTELCMSASIYDALERAGFDGGLLDGRSWVLDWREATHLYTYGGGLRLLCRHHTLSDDVGYRFSNRGWSCYPLTADTYAGWIRATAGEFVLLGWDFETFGEHHPAESGIFAFLEHLPHELARRGVRFATPGELVERHRDTASILPLPISPTTWAGSGGMDFFLGNGAQQHLFELMLHVFGEARLTDDPRLVDLALLLAQSDHLHCIQWYGRSGPEAEVSTYFTPREWWELGPEGILAEQRQVYANVLRALEEHLPERRARAERARATARSAAEHALSALGLDARY